MNWRVLIVDDEKPARDKVRHFLSGEENFYIIGEAENGIEALKKINTLKPNLVFLDIKMPVVDGMSVAAHLESKRRIKIVFVTGFNDYAVELEMLPTDER